MQAKVDHVLSSILFQSPFHLKSFFFNVYRFLYTFFIRYALLFDFISVKRTE